MKFRSWAALLKCLVEAGLSFTFYNFSFFVRKFWKSQNSNTIPRCHQKFFHRDKTSQWLLKSILVFKEQWRTRFLFHTKTSEISQILNLISKFWTLALVPKDFISKLIVRSEHIYNTTYKPSPAFCWGMGTTFSPKFWKGRDQTKMNAWGDLKSSGHRYLPGGSGVTFFLVKKDFKK